MRKVKLFESFINKDGELEGLDKNIDNIEKLKYLFESLGYDVMKHEEHGYFFEAHINGEFHNIWLEEYI